MPGIENTFLGSIPVNSPAGNASGSGNQNTALGHEAFRAVTTSNGGANVALGAWVLNAATSAFGNVAVGALAMLDGKNVADSVAIGYEAAKKVQSGVGLTATGRLSCSTMTDGGNNTGYGDSTLRFTTSGLANVAVGYRSGEANSTGESNVYLGSFAGSGVPVGGPPATSFDGGVKTGKRNILIGSTAGYGPTQKPDVENSIGIGFGVVTDKNNQVILGNTSVIETVLRGVLKSTVYTVATLPTVAALGANATGARAFVSDAANPVFGNPALGGGAVKVPVYCDGSSWRVG